MTFIVSQNEKLHSLDELRDIFNKLDHSGDGLLQLEEITTGLKKVYGIVKGNMKIFEEIMISLDRNCNGVIDYTEFLTAASNKDNLLTEINLQFAFKMFDKDNSGTISREELRALFETTEKKDDELWNEIFNEVDLNGDGQITYEEFSHSMQ